MGTGSAQGGGASVREKLSNLASKLVKLGSKSLSGLKAIFSEMKAVEDKVFVSPPGLKRREVPNSTVPQLAREQASLSEIFKIGSLTALSLVLNNPIPLMFAQGISRNIRERIKAKEKELKKAEKAANSALKKAIADKKKQQQINAKRKQKANANKVKMNQALKKQAGNYRKQLTVAQRRANTGGTKPKLTDRDKKRMNSAEKTLRQLGFGKELARRAIALAVKRTSPKNVGDLIGASFKEAAILKKRG